MHGFGQAADMCAFAPKAQLTAIIDNWGAVLHRPRRRRCWTAAGSRQNAGMASRKAWSAWRPTDRTVPPEVAAAADTVKAEIIAGTRHPFTGPIMDQAGTERWARA